MPLLQATDTIRRAAVSIFSDHALQPVDAVPVFRNGTPYYWPVVLLFVVFSMYVYLNFTNPKKLLQVFLSVYSNQASKQLYREDYRLTKSMSVLLSLSFVMVMAFLLFVCNNYFGFILQDLQPLKQFLFFTAVILLMYIVKLSSNYFIGFSTMSQELNHEYIFNVFISSQTLGVVLLPLVICIQFSRYPTEWFLYPAIILCGAFYILRFIRGFIISVVEQNVGIVYIFLYLCALEILPLLVLIKFLLVNF
jgi:hypothetical protein